MKNEKRKLTIHDLAKRANVSVATISRCLNPETRNKVAPETLRAIDALIEQYHYTPNIAAQHMRQASHRTIGILFPHHEGIFLSEYYSYILSGISDSLLNTHYTLKMILLKATPPRWDRYDFKAGEGVDGLIVTYWRSFFSNASVIEQLKIPCVVINNVEDDVKAHYVAGDHFQGGELAAQYLYFHGHRNIAVMSGRDGAPDAYHRLKGFLSFMNLKGFPVNPELILDTGFEEEKAYHLTGQLVSIHPQITAIFCMNDILAFGVMKKLKELGIDCPGRISVMGYDNDRRAEHSNPPLTTLHAHVYEAAKRSAECLIQHLKDKDSQGPEFTRELLPISLVERGSVRKID